MPWIANAPNTNISRKCISRSCSIGSTLHVQPNSVLRAVIRLTHASRPTLERIDSAKAT
jgi:hypothetical protein